MKIITISHHLIITNHYCQSVAVSAIITFCRSGVLIDQDQGCSRRKLCGSGAFFKGPRAFTGTKSLGYSLNPNTTDLSETYLIHQKCTSNVDWGQPYLDLLIPDFVPSREDCTKVDWTRNRTKLYRIYRPCGGKKSCC